MSGNTSAAPPSTPSIESIPKHLWLDASAYDSSTDGITWRDRSGNDYNFTINTGAYRTDAGGIVHMDFTGPYFIAKRLVNGTLTDVPLPSSGTYTIMCVSQILNSSADWRTLVRGQIEDHHVLVQAGTNNLGMYDNGGAGFLDSGFDITSALTGSWNLLTWVLTNTSSPYYKFQANESGTDSVISNSSSILNRGFSTVGGWHNNTNSMTSASQFWGKIAEFIVIDGVLSTADRQAISIYLGQKYGISSKLPAVQPAVQDTSGALDTLSLYNTNMNAAYSVRRLFSEYSGPQLRVRRSSDNAQIDVYTDGTGSVVTPTDWNTWSSGVTLYVTIIYDQSGNNRNAVNSGNSTYNETQRNILFSSTGYFDLPNSTLPTGSGQYTIYYHHGTVNGNSLFSGGNIGSTNQVLAASIMGSNYRHYWWGNDLDGGTNVSGNYMTFTWNGGTRVIYQNGSVVASGGASGKNTGSGNHRIGRENANNWYLNGEFKEMIIFSIGHNSTLIGNVYNLK